MIQVEIDILNKESAVKSAQLALSAGKKYDD